MRMSGIAVSMFALAERSRFSWSRTGRAPRHTPISITMMRMASCALRSVHWNQYAFSLMDLQMCNIGISLDSELFCSLPVDFGPVVDLAVDVVNPRIYLLLADYRIVCVDVDGILSVHAPLQTSLVLASEAYRRPRLSVAQNGLVVADSLSRTLFYLRPELDSVTASYSLTSNVLSMDSGTSANDVVLTFDNSPDVWVLSLGTGRANVHETDCYGDIMCVRSLDSLGVVDTARGMVRLRPDNAQGWEYLRYAAAQRTASTLGDGGMVTYSWGTDSAVSSRYVFVSHASRRRYIPDLWVLDFVHHVTRSFNLVAQREVIGVAPSWTPERALLLCRCSDWSFELRLTMPL